MRWQHVFQVTYSLIRGANGLLFRNGVSSATKTTNNITRVLLPGL
jgi:hypothetical protein